MMSRVAEKKRIDRSIDRTDPDLVVPFIKEDEERMDEEGQFLGKCVGVEHLDVVDMDLTPS